MQAVADLLQRCASVHGDPSAQEVLNQRQDAVAGLANSEDFLGVSVLTFATGAVAGLTLEMREDCVKGLESCLAAAAQGLDVDAVARLQRSVLERTLRKFDASGDALADRASTVVLWPGQSVAAATEPLRAVLALLFRCVGTERITAQELLDLARGDVAVAMAIIAEAFNAPKPAGLPGWSAQLARILHQLTSPDILVWLLQRADPSRDFNSTPIAEMHTKQQLHAQALALSFVQFEVLDRALNAAEDASQRQVVLTALIRTMHNLVRDRTLLEPGRLLGRCIAMDFMRFGFRFLAPLARKLIDASRTAEPARLLRHTCRTLSWLLVHAEMDGSTFLASSLKPLASEWLLRALQRSLLPQSLAALLLLAANCGGLEGPAQALAQAQVERLREQAESEIVRCHAVTVAGAEALGALGFSVAVDDVPDGVLEADLDGDLGAGDLDDGWYEAGTMPWFDGEDDEGEMTGIVVPQGNLCKECGRVSTEGMAGEDYFAGFWYCQQCWDSWSEVMPGRVCLSPWPDEGCGIEAPEQRGAAALLLKMPARLRCGIGGGVLVEVPLRIPGSFQAAVPVAFRRINLERWMRRSGGHCPLTLQPLDLRSAQEAPDMPDAVRAWLEANWSGAR